MATPKSVEDDLDDLLGVGPDDISSSTKSVPPVEEDEPDVEKDDPEEPEDEPEQAPAAAEPPAQKPKRTRRTKAEMEAARKIEAAKSMSEEEAQAAYLAELRARLSGGTVKPESTLTPLEREIRQAEDALAAKTAQEIDAAEPQYEKPSEGAETILIHVVNDGIPINGQMTYRGQEFEFEVGGLAYNQTLDRNGDTFLNIVGDIDAQYRRWGEQKFGLGPWPGKRSGYTIADAPRDLKQEEKAQWVADMNAHAAAEARRGRAAPVRLAGI